MSKDLLIYVDGEFLSKNDAKVSVFDHGLLYGDGVFEGIRTYNNRVFKLDAHIDRLYDSARTIMLDIPISKSEMTDIVINTCKKNNLADGYIRLVVTRGIGDLGLSPLKCPNPTIFCIATDISLYPEEMYEKGLPVITSTYRRNKATIVDPQIKSLNYLNNILAKIEANRAGVQEAIMLNQDGIVAECTGDNIFIVKNGILYTPPIYIGALDGITRKTIIQLALKLNIPFFEKEFSLFNVYNADECFLTGTAAEAIAVTDVDGRVIADGVAGPITKKLLSAFKSYVSSEGTPIE